ncbi:MAG: hypothetical protein ACFFD7_04770 [Candidatus Thorarchaeota archaeon]
MNKRVPARSNAIAIDIKKGEAFSDEIRKVIIQIIRRIIAMRSIIKEMFLILLSNSSNSSIFIAKGIYCL